MTRPLLGCGPTWTCTRDGCHMVRTTACKPAGCANDLVDRRKFKAQSRGLTVNDKVDFTDGWDE